MTQQILMLGARSIVAIASCLAAFNAWAADQAQIDVFKTLAQCQGSAQQISEFNRLVDAQQVTFTQDKPNSPWGGAAWHVTPALSVNGVSSSTLVMSDRFSFYLQASSSTPLADAQALAAALQLEKTLDTQGYVDYQRRLKNGAALRVVSTENKDRDLYVGCSYPQYAS